MGFATVAQLLEGVAQLRRELRNSRAARDLHAKTPQLSRNSCHSRRNSTARPLPLKYAGQIRSPGSSPRAATDPALRGARISMAAAVQWSCGYSCGRVAPGGAQLSCATPRNSVAQLTATPPQLVRNSSATRPQLLTATVSGRRCRVFTTPRGAASLHTDLEKACAKFRSDSYALAARGFVGKLVATVAQLRRNCCATRPQLGRNSSQLSCATPRNSRATRELRNCCATVASCATVARELRNSCETHEFLVELLTSFILLAP